MNRILNMGRYIFPLSFLLYVSLHLGLPEMGASFVPSWIPFPYFWNYFTGLLIVLFIVSCLLQKFDKLATVLMAVYVLLMIILVHVPRASQYQNDMFNIFRNIMIIGALLVYARYAAKDPRVVG